jgi:hypothetical protein
MDRPILSSSESGTEKPHQTRTGISHKAVLGGMVIDIDVATKKVVVRRARIEIDVITGRSSLFSTCKPEEVVTLVVVGGFGFGDSSSK